MLLHFLPANIWLRKFTFYIFFSFLMNFLTNYLAFKAFCNQFNQLCPPFVFLNFWLVKRVQPITVVQDQMNEKTHGTPKTYKNVKTTKQLLGKFYSDKKFLEDLMKDEGAAFSYHLHLFTSLLFGLSQYTVVLPKQHFSLSSIFTIFIYLFFALWRDYFNCFCAVKTWLKVWQRVANEWRTSFRAASHLLRNTLSSGVRRNRFPFKKRNRQRVQQKCLLNRLSLCWKALMIQKQVGWAPG